MSFLEELDELDSPTEVSDAVIDACKLAVAPGASDEDITVGLAAATLAAIWEGAPYTCSDVAEDYAVVRTMIGRHDADELVPAAAAVFEQRTDDDTAELVEEFAEALIE